MECLVRVSYPKLLHDDVTLAVEDGELHLLVCFTTGLRRVKSTEPECFPMCDASLDDDANFICRLAHLPVLVRHGSDSVSDREDRNRHQGNQRDQFSLRTEYFHLGLLTGFKLSSMLLGAAVRYSAHMITPQKRDVTR